MTDTAVTRTNDDEMTLNELKPKGMLNQPENLRLGEPQQSSTQKGWHEIKMTGKLPERRSYQISEVHDGYLYIFGGQDLKEGMYNSLWRLPLSHIMEGGSTAWEKVTKTLGQTPPPISHHSASIHQDTMYVYGGLVKGDSNLRMFTLNLKSQTWGVIDKSANELMPAARDDHSACSSEDTNSMFIFGGYVRGGKANDLWRYDFETNEWHELDDGDYHITNHKLLLKEQGKRPCPRIGSTINFYKNNLYLFGGHDQSNEKLFDFWKFDLTTNLWSQIKPEGQQPEGRNGHTMVQIYDKLVLFGGIIEVTKESDEVFIYDFASNKWSLQDLPNLGEGRVSSFNLREGESPRLGDLSINKKSSMNLKKLKHSSSVPTLHNQIDSNKHKYGTNNTLNSSQQLEGSMINQKRNDRGQASSLTRKGTLNQGDPQFAKYMRGQTLLGSPTSIQMKNAFILKNSNPSFESYFQSMKRRRVLRNGISMNFSITLDNDTKKSIHIQKNKPSARDGHSSFVFQNKMFIFGGDRHHMPFNDLFFLDIDY